MFMSWTVHILEVAAGEIESLPADMQVRFRRIVERIQLLGLEQMREPQVRHLESRLWEMRMTGRDGISRAIYMTASGRRVIVLRAFIKKTQKTPRSEIELAYRRAKEFL
jgi:phage-related protein